MCGIVGYIGKRRKANFLIEKLQLLEYTLKKCVGKIENLKNELTENLEVNCAIAHTRWATHGKVNLKNTHPHVSSAGEWAVVHNGIIENYQKLASEKLGNADFESDTAVATEILEKDGVQTIFDFIQTFEKMRGSFAICAINRFQNKLFLAKRKSPLYVSKNEDGDFLVASDPICFKDFSKKYYCLDDDEFALLSPGKIEFFTSKQIRLKKAELEATETYSNFGKHAFSSFMMKEIFEEEEALKRQVEVYRQTKILSKFSKKFLDSFEKVLFVGCGTAYHAGMIGAKYFQKILKINAQAEFASELIYAEPVFIDRQTLCIFVSQSGETADTLSAFELAKNQGATCVCLTNVMHSTLAKKADIVLPVCAGTEIAVASTKAYVCQLSAIYMFACSLANLKFNLNINYFQDILKVSNKLLNFDKKKINGLAEFLKDKPLCFFIGKDIDFITSLEASLKLKETTYLCSIAHPSGELKHGYLALIEDGTPLIAIASQKKTNIKTFNSMREAQSRGAKLFLMTNESEARESKNAIFFDEENELLLPITQIVPLQYLACKVCELKGIDPDKPRNLAKSVTVE